MKYHGNSFGKLKYSETQSWCQSHKWFFTRKKIGCRLNFTKNPCLTIISLWILHTPPKCRCCVMQNFEDDSVFVSREHGYKNCHLSKGVWFRWMAHISQGRQSQLLPCIKIYSDYNQDMVRVFQDVIRRKLFVYNSLTCGSAIPSDTCPETLLLRALVHIK